MQKRIKRTFTVFISVILFSLLLSSVAFGAKASVGTVSNLKATTYSTKVTLSWKKAKNARKYKIYEKKNGKWKVKATTKRTFYSFKKLSAGSKHIYAVRAYSKSNKPSKNRKTITLVTKPYTVKNIKATTTEDSVALSWSKSKGATGYTVYQFDDSQDKWIKVKTTVSPKATLGKLYPGTSYTFGIRAYTKKGGKTSQAKAVTKINICTEPRVPSSLIVKELTDTSATLSWEKGEGASAYRVYRYDSNKKVWVTIIENTTDTSAVIESLKKGTEYIFAVKALKINGDKVIKSKKQAEVKLKTSAPTKATSKAIQLIVDSYAYGDGTIFVETSSSNWDGKFASATENIYVTVDGEKVKIPVPCKVTANSNEIKIDISGLNVESGSTVNFTIPAGVVKNQAGTQTNTSFSASVTV